MNPLYRWAPQFVGTLILIAVGIALDISITRDERRQRAASDRAEGGAAQP